MSRDAIAFEHRHAGGIEGLRPNELELSRAFGPARLADFAAGRDCAHRALDAIGYPGVDLAMTEDRLPQWPAGVVGSITHARGFIGAVVGTRASYSSIGIDAETIERISSDLWPKICTPAEIRLLMQTDLGERTRLGALLFSAREAFYKCQFPLTRMRIAFDEIQVQLESTTALSGEFSIEPLSRECRERFAKLTLCGRFRCEGALVATGMAFGPNVLL